MNSLIVSSTIILISICIGRVLGKCGPNQEFTDCGNFCTEKCYDGVHKVCPTICESGCFCKSGFKRHPNGTCVTPVECPNTCNDPNEEWRESNACSEACDRAVKLCQYGTHFGCHCKDGYLRDPKTGICIPECQCPLIGADIHCNYTQVYKCGNDCWDYCDDGALRKCSGDCRFGCYCKDGYKLNPITNECVPPEKCPCPPKPSPVCTGPYEEFKSDGNPCMDNCNKEVVRCANDQKPGCYCKDGYARDLDTGVCRPHPCKDCGSNAEWVNCAGPCDNFCDFVLGRDTCKIVNIKCPDDCRCIKGYARATNSPDSFCIKESSCSLFDYYAPQPFT